MSTNEPWTIRRLLEWTTEYLKKYGSESARLDAEVLLSHVLDCDRIHLYTAYDEIASEETRNEFRNLVTKRAESVPVAYLVGYREFFSLAFEVNPNVLIPRPETEYVVTSLLDRAKEIGLAHAPLSIADIGTGSGILAICAAKHLTAATVVAVDVSTAALEVAAKNAAKHQVSGRIQFFESDLFTNLDNECQFDFIVSNPPYIRETDRPTLPRDVRDHEPSESLFAGEDGLDVIRQLIADAPSFLKSKGCLLFEISPEQEAAVLDLGTQQKSFLPGHVIKDLSGQTRVMQLLRYD